MKSDFPIDNKPELRNCPFCGNEAYLIGLFVPYDDDEINEYQVGCEECGIHFNQSWEYDIIVDLWNGEYYKNVGIFDKCGATIVPCDFKIFNKEEAKIYIDKLQSIVDQIEE